MIIATGSVVYATETIPISTSTSGIITTKGMCLCGIQLPASFTGTALTFTAATAVDGTYQAVYNKSGLVSYTVAAGRYQAIDPLDFHGVQFMKIVSNGTEAAARTLICSLKGI